MANVITLKATERTEFGKGPARRLRAAGQVPAVVYGQGHDPKHIVLEGHESMLALRQENQLLSIEVEGQSPVLALPKEVQRDVMTGFLKHVDLLSITSGQKVGVQVALRTISVEGLEAGSSILFKDITLPEGVELVDDPDEVVASVQFPDAEDLGDEEEDAEDESEEAAE